MKSFKPIILATAVATCFLVQDAFAAEARPDASIVVAAATEPADLAVLIASSDGAAGIEQAGEPAVGWDPGKRGARNAALQGPDALRRFVERTRTIYALQYGDFAPLGR